MIELKTTRKDAIAKASSEEMLIAGQLAHAVLERHQAGADRSSTWADQVALQETALFAQQLLQFARGMLRTLLQVNMQQARQVGQQLGVAGGLALEAGDHAAPADLLVHPPAPWL